MVNKLIILFCISSFGDASVLKAQSEVVESAGLVDLLYLAGVGYFIGDGSRSLESMRQSSLVTLRVGKKAHACL